MAQIVDCAGDHGTGNLKEDEAGTGVDVSLSRALKGQQ
jgi:hypothetical protein